MHRRQEEKDKNVHFRRGCARSFIVHPYAEVALWKVERRFFFCYILRRAKDPRVSTKARVAGRQSAWKEAVCDAGAPIKTCGSKSSPASATPRDRESVRDVVKEGGKGGGRRREKVPPVHIRHNSSSQNFPARSRVRSQLYAKLIVSRLEGTRVFN